ncbi:MAG: CDP-alcohol phosphatidyltransferase family protein [Bacillota bacterium]|nr:CDP-alcohol phosphatidyltransferase family protein [Bacillota bacterium]
MKNIPNILTTIRILLVPFVPIAYFNYSPYLALLIYFIAGITDILDGYLARKYNAISKFGSALDPFADKLMLITSLVTLTIDKQIPIFIVIIVSLKELLLIITGIFVYIKHEQLIISSNKIGKASTLIFFIAIVETVLLNIEIINISLFMIALFIAIIALTTYIHDYMTKKEK